MTVAQNVGYGLMVRKIPGRRARQAGRGCAGDGSSRAVGEPQAGATLRRATTTRRARAIAGAAAEGPPARRAARRARPEAPAGDADRAQGDPAGGGPHLHLRDARPGGGAHDERPSRRLQPGEDRAGWVACRGLRAAGDRASSPDSSACRTSSRARSPGGSPGAATRSRSVRRRSRSCRSDAEVAESRCTATGSVREVVYLGAITRYVVELDGGGSWW